MTEGQHRIIRLEETDSTNKDAMRLALQGENLPLWVIADRQTAGRGRAGRSWVSEPGNLHASLAVCCMAPLDRAGELSLVSGISLIDAIRSLSALQPDAGLRLKWPNDLLVGTAKAGGILVESTTARGQPGFLAVIGFGVNIVAYPAELGRMVTSLGACGAQISAGELLDILACRIGEWLEIWDGGAGFDRIRRAWLERAGPLGEPITVNTSRGVLAGSFEGLSDSGALLLRTGADVREISYGDVTIVEGAPQQGAL
jgi:BirA family biotin operon repressor/biotin-[acetyl-CoA-carboxylase] ligase